MAWLDGLDAYGNYLQPPSVGGQIAVPGGYFLGKAFADGVQMYEAKDEQDDLVSVLWWDLVGPDASLTDDVGNSVGHHDVGPIWSCYADNSTVKGVRRGEESGGDGNIAWLLLEAIEWSGPVMSRVQYVQRVDTRDGKPTRKAASVGEKDSFHYTATYNFWGLLPS